MVKNGFSEVCDLQQGLIDWQRNCFALQQSETAIASKNDSKAFSSNEFETILNSNQLVLVDFYAAWCAPCRSKSSIVDQLSDKYKHKVEKVKIDIEANQNLSQSLEVQSILGFTLFKNVQKKEWLL